MFGCGPKGLVLADSLFLKSLISYLKTNANANGYFSIPHSLVNYTGHDGKAEKTVLTK